MGQYLLCQKTAQMPYEIEEMGLHIYSAEELCYYIYHNLPMIDDSFINEALIEFIRKDLDMPLRIREKTNRGEKQIIAGLVKDLIEEGDRIMLDASSTSLMIAKELKEMEKLTVITNSVEVLIELAGHDGIQVISTGGNLNETSLSLVGNAAQKVLNGYHVDKAVFSCKGIDMKDGITDSNELDSDIKNVMYACADTAILAVDSSKFDKVSFVKSMRLKQGDILVTDRLPSEDWQNYLQERGVQLVTPEAQEQDQK